MYQTLSDQSYPEWGPAKHDPDSPIAQMAGRSALDLRDEGELRPEDN